MRIEVFKVMHFSKTIEIPNDADPNIEAANCLMDWDDLSEVTHVWYESEEE